MEEIYNRIENNEVYPIKIIYKGKNYLILYYYTKDGDCFFRGKNNGILSFLQVENMQKFCKEKGLKIGDEIVEYDFDAPIINPIDYKKVLDGWNLLNTISQMFKMFFEGDLKKYNTLYDFLFRLNTSVETIPPTCFIDNKNYKYILKVFKKKSRFLNKFEIYVD